MEKSENIVMEWLKSLSLSQHGSSFIDNGYDDLEICKKIGDQDLDAIGVLNVCERMRILDAVNNLKLNGGTSVYLAIEEHMKRNKCNSPASSDRTRNSSRPNSMSSEERCCSGSSKEIYQESTGGDLTRIPLPKLQRLIKDKLRQDGIKLFNPPYSSLNGDRGYLEGLASHYADDLKTFYTDVLNVLEEIRVEEWKNMSPRMMLLQDGISSVPILPSTGNSGSSHGSAAMSQMSLETPQTIYAPGKYSPSSCLSHCEEDVIYGFGGERPNSGACIFPFGEKASTNHKKKPGGISKLLRTLRVRREKSPRHVCQPHARQGRKTVSQNCKSMTVVYPRPALLTADPKTQRRRVLQMARDGELSLEEAMAWLRISRIEESRSAGIYCNTKDQTVKYLKYSARSHSQSPAHSHGNSVNGPQTCCCQTPGYSSQACEAVVHWYDEPSYENQDEYFLRRNCLKNNDSCEAISPCCTQDSDVISLPSAGDIALGRHGQVYTRESPIGSSGRISSEELLCSNELSSFGVKDKCCNISQWNRNCWDTGDYIRQRSVRDSGDYAGSDSRSLSISSLEDPPSSHVIGRCRALIDIPQDSRDSSFLSLKKGETVDILSTRPDGLWVGRTSQGTGTLLASTVEVLNVGRSGVTGSSCCTSRHCLTLNEQGGTFSAIKNLLKTFGCEEHLALLISNGYDDLEALRNLELSDLDLLGIRDAQSRANLLLVVRYLHQTVDVQTRPVFTDSRQSVRSNFPVGCSPNYREPKDATLIGSGRAKRPTLLHQYNIPVGQRCCGQDYVNGELCSSANPDASSLLGRLQLAESASRDPPREEERDTFGDFGKRYGSEKSSDSGISVRSRSPAVQSPGQKSDGIFSSKRFVKQNSHQNIMS